MEENDIKAVQNTLGSPIICEFSTPVQKIRSILVFFSIVGLLVTLGDLSIDSDSSLLGLKFNNLSPDFINNT
jgi:hypothetical protein